MNSLTLLQPCRKRTLVLSCHKFKKTKLQHEFDAGQLCWNHAIPILGLNWDSMHFSLHKTSINATEEQTLFQQVKMLCCVLFIPILLLTETFAAGESVNNETSAGELTRERPPYTLLPYPPRHLRPYQVYSCGRTINDTRGFIHTPEFPKRFPVPILCRWIIKSSPGKKIVLYFTQFYMRDSFQLTEYDSYTDENTYQGKHELGTISFVDEVTSVSVYRPWLVLKFQVSWLQNLNLWPKIPHPTPHPLSAFKLVMVKGFSVWANQAEKCSLDF